MLGNISHSSIRIYNLLRFSICTVPGKYTSEAFRRTSSFSVRLYYSTIVSTVNW